MPSTDRRDLFDAWARTYDDTIRPSDAFPFAGYETILDRIANECRPLSGRRLLDVGIGTGNLAQRLTALDAESRGLDFSEEMLERCRAKLPEAQLIRADLRQGLPPDLPEAFDRIVSAYVLHEFPDDDKLRPFGSSWIVLPPTALLSSETSPSPTSRRGPRLNKPGAMRGMRMSTTGPPSGWSRRFKRRDSTCASTRSRSAAACSSCREP